jgi:hypothetical protein
MPSFDPSDTTPDVVIERETSQPDGRQGKFRLFLRTRSIAAGILLLAGVGGGVGARAISHDDLDPMFRSCVEAKSHGYGSYREGEDAEYDWYRDADDDGIVCD